MQQRICTVQNRYFCFPLIKNSFSLRQINSKVIGTFSIGKNRFEIQWTATCNARLLVLYFTVKQLYLYSGQKVNVGINISYMTGSLIRPEPENIGLTFRFFYFNFTCNLPVRTISAFYDLYSTRSLSVIIKSYRSRCLNMCDKIYQIRLSVWIVLIS
jgi:hypothetical protein